MASLPSTDPIGAEDVRLHLSRILNSETFRKALSLRHLLEYVVTEWAGGHSQQIKESVIAVEVFGRRVDFDGRIDNIVRVQAHRLRKLLETYYAAEGKQDRLHFSIPKGSYVPHVSYPEADQPQPEIAVLATPRAGIPAAAEVNLLPSSRELTVEPAAHDWHPSHGRAYRSLATYVGVFLAGALLVGFIPPRFLPFSGRLDRLYQRSLGEQAPNPAVEEIWRGIFQPKVKSIISFTSPVFLRVGQSQAYLLYHGPLSAPEGTEMSVAAESDPYLDRQFTSNGERLFFSDGWSGTGEVLAMNRLTTLASQLFDSPAVAPSRSLTMNDIHGANVIFLGAPSMNGTISRIGTESAPLYATGDGSIVIRQPAPGEKASYSNIEDAETKQLKTCYALFSVLPGAEEGRKIASSAGLGSWATWAAIDFLTIPSGASQLAKALKAENAGKLPSYYQAVVRSDIINGSVTNQSLVSTRVVRR